MKILSSKVHGFLDYFVVLVFAVSPSILHFSEIPKDISYALAGVHLVLTLSTNFALGLFKVIPLKFHGMIELVVGPVLVVLPFVLGMTAEPAAEYFYVANGITIFVVWALTDYSRK